MNVDLHTHSTASDGTLSPHELLAVAAASGVELLALTDHDTLAGFDALRGTASPLTLLPGVELSVAWTRRDVHVVGLNFDPDNRQLRALLDAQQQARAERAARIAAKLERRGADNMLALAREQAGGRTPGRVHFARGLVAAGVVKTTRDAFRRLLGDGKPADVRGDWVKLDDAINALRRAGGEAILAHPLTYRLSATGLRALLNEFAAAGGTAVEWADVSEHPNLARVLDERITAHRLAVSSGSDFHGSTQPWRRLGRIEPVPEHLPRIYERWQVASG
ncbi:MAG: PHP domain-containing protein [Pseudomonadota bacterium]